MNVVVLEGPSKAEWAEDFDPIPLVAVAYCAKALTPYQLALPNGNGGYCAKFEIDEAVRANGVLARIGDQRPTGIPFSGGAYGLRPGDILEVIVYIHRRQ